MKGNGCLKRHGKWRCLYPSPAVMNVAVWGEGRVKRGYSHLAYRWGDWVSQGRGGTARPDSSRSPSPTWLLMVPACERDVRVRGPHRESSITSWTLRPHFPRVPPLTRAGLYLQSNETEANTSMGLEPRLPWTCVVRSSRAWGSTAVPLLYNFINIT